MASDVALMLPVLEKIASHLEDVRKIITDRTVTLTANAALMRRDSVLVAINGPVP